MNRDEVNELVNSRMDYINSHLEDTFMIKEYTDVNFEEHYAFCKHPEKPYSDSIVWCPISTGIEAKDLEVIDVITTFHTASSCIFKPSMAEIIAQIPEELYDKGINCFEIESYTYLGDVYKAIVILCKASNLPNRE